MEPFDPYAVTCPSLPPMTVDQHRRMSFDEKMNRMWQAFLYVREEHRKHVRRRDPHATEADIKLDRWRLGGVKEEVLMGLMLAKEDEFLDKPILVSAQEART